MTRVALRMLVLIVVAAAIIAPAPVGAARQDKDAEYTAQLQQGDAALAKRQWEDALKAFKRASDLHGKTSAEAHAGMARAYAGKGAHKNAVESWTAALKSTAANRKLEAVCRNQRGMSLFSMADSPTDKKVKQAEEDFRAALAIDDSLAIAHYNLGVALMRQSRDEEGAAQLRTFADAYPTAPEVRQARRFLENPRRARENFAPDFAVVTLDEKRLSLEDLKGKVVLLDFWASWCVPCEQATPGLLKLQKKYAERNFTILGVSLDRNEGPWRNYIDGHKMTWPQYWDKEARLARLFGIEPIPTYILLDHEGLVAETQQGWSPSVDGWLDGRVKQLLKKADEAGMKLVR